MQALDESLAPGKVSGARYREWIMATIDRFCETRQKLAPEQGTGLNFRNPTF
jgi:hypothetical protein